MPPVKNALILLPVCWPSVSFEDFAQFQLLPRACKHISALISSQIWLWPQEAQALWDVRGLSGSYCSRMSAWTGSARCCSLFLMLQYLPPPLHGVLADRWPEEMCNLSRRGWDVHCGGSLSHIISLLPWPAHFTDGRHRLRCGCASGGSGSAEGETVAIPASLRRKNILSGLLSRCKDAGACVRSCWQMVVITVIVSLPPPLSSSCFSVLIFYNFLLNHQIIPK